MNCLLFFVFIVSTLIVPGISTLCGIHNFIIIRFINFRYTSVIVLSHHLLHLENIGLISLFLVSYQNLNTWGKNINFAENLHPVRPYPTSYVTVFSRFQADMLLILPSYFIMLWLFEIEAGSVTCLCAWILFLALCSFPRFVL